MQAYYISVDNAQANKPATSMMDKMKQWLQRSFF
jgi:CRISPR/Cas system-associated endoribonuclease Cas2